MRGLKAVISGGNELENNTRVLELQFRVSKVATEIFRSFLKTMMIQKTRFEQGDSHNNIYSLFHKCPKELAVKQTSSCLDPFGMMLADCVKRVSYD